MNGRTWHQLARIERGLLQLAEDARNAYYRSEPGAWMQIVGRLTALVGPLSSGRLRRREHYRLARTHLQRCYLTGNGQWQPPTDSWAEDDAAGREAVSHAGRPAGEGGVHDQTMPPSKGTTKF